MEKLMPETIQELLERTDNTFSFIEEMLPQIVDEAKQEVIKEIREYAEELMTKHGMAWLTISGRALHYRLDDIEKKFNLPNTCPLERNPT